MAKAKKIFTTEAPSHGEGRDWVIWGSVDLVIW
jgi:hypothetical protein